MSALHTVLAALLAAALLAGYGQGGTATDVAQPPADDGPAAAGPRLLQVEQTGGLVPVEVAFRSLPELTVHDDGRALVLGPQPAVFPGPALPNVQQHALDDDRLAALVEQARQAGLLSTPPDYGSPPVADATTTRVLLQVGGERYAHEAYALGLDAGLPGAPSVEDDLPPAAQQARQRLSAFLERARQLVEESGESTPYVPDAYALRATPVPAPDGTGPAGAATEPGPVEPPPVEPQVLPWPLPEVDLSAAAECLVVEGDAARLLREALQPADALTRFTAGGVAYDVAVRPVLPHGNGC